MYVGIINNEQALNDYSIRVFIDRMSDVGTCMLESVTKCGIALWKQTVHRGMSYTVWMDKDGCAISVFQGNSLKKKQLRVTCSIFTYRLNTILLHRWQNTVSLLKDNSLLFGWSISIQCRRKKTITRSFVHIITRTYNGMSPIGSWTLVDMPDGVMTSLKAKYYYNIVRDYFRITGPRDRQSRKWILGEIKEK